jgi:hypothetical protein
MRPVKRTTVAHLTYFPPLQPWGIFHGALAS